MADELPPLDGSILREVSRLARVLGKGRRAGLVCRVPGGMAERLMTLRTPPGKASSGPLSLSFWGPSGGDEWAGIGEAKCFRAEGPDRLKRLQKQLEEWFASFDNYSEISGRLRVFGGTSFGLSRDALGPWGRFGEACFIAPRILYGSQGADAGWLLITVDPTGEGDGELELHALLTVLGSIFDSARDGSTRMRGQELRLAERGALRPDPGWIRMVQAAKHEIRAGRLKKVVLARRVTYELTDTPDLGEVLEHLAQQRAIATRFAFHRSGATFVGATPELLARVNGSILQTEALAGTVPKSTIGAEARLFESSKERLEHALVVEAIVGAIEPLSSELSVPSEPEVIELPNLFHLRTPITARLRERTPVLDVIERLHPTPAVGGVPRAEALAYIEQNEPDARGWYAGPFGWVDGAGNGEFVVALRSALIEDKTASLFAGAGIVGDSDPELEFQETEVKLARMRVALGLRVSGDSPNAAQERVSTVELRDQP
jgi:isochorismate synthase